MKRKNLTGKRYFYSLGQSTRAKGLTKEQGIVLHTIHAALPYAQIYFDKGYRGFSLN